MLKTVPELVQDLAARIRARRGALGWPQTEAARRAGIAYRTWRRLETQGMASVEDLVKAAVALRCEEGLAALFPAPVAGSLDALLEQQRAAARESPSPQGRIKRRRGATP